MIYPLLLAIGLLQTPVVLSITYGDGRTARHIVGAKPTRSWTPYFPKTAEWRSPEGLAVTAINYVQSPERGGVRVTISLFLGSPHQKEISVAHVLVTPENPVRVSALEPFGVEPVLLALADFDRRALPPPRVENKTAALQIESVEMADESRPGYHIRVRNVSNTPVLSFFIDSFRDGKPALSSRRVERDGSPIVAARATHTFFLGTEHPLDVFRITGLMFEDGSVEGDAADVATTRVVHLGRRLQLARAIAILQEAAGNGTDDVAAAVAAIRRRFEALPALGDAGSRSFGASLLPADGHSTPAGSLETALAAGLVDVRKGVLSDLQDAPQERGAFTQWLRDITAQYQTWHQRFADLTAR